MSLRTWCALCYLFHAFWISFSIVRPFSSGISFFFLILFEEDDLERSRSFLSRAFVESMPRLPFHIRNDGFSLFDISFRWRHPERLFFAGVLPLRFIVIDHRPFSIVAFYG